MRAGCVNCAREVEDVAHRGAAERVDALRVVAHHRDALPGRLHRQDDLRLQAVGVLVFVDQHVVEARADLLRPARLGHHLGPEQQQVVVVQHVLLLLGFDIGAEQLLQLVLPLAAPGVGVLQHLVERVAGVEHARVDAQAGALERKAVLGLRQADLVAHHAHQVFGIAAVVDGEGLLQADARRVLAQQPRADAVEGAASRAGWAATALAAGPAPAAARRRRAAPSPAPRGG